MGTLGCYTLSCNRLRKDADEQEFLVDNDKCGELEGSVKDCVRLAPT